MLALSFPTMLFPTSSRVTYVATAIVSLRFSPRIKNERNKEVHTLSGCVSTLTLPCFQPCSFYVHQFRTLVPGFNQKRHTLVDERLELYTTAIRCEILHAEEAKME